MDESEKESGVKIVDRRRFSTVGESKPEEASGASPVQEIEKPTKRTPPSEAEEKRPELPPAEFSSFVYGLAMQVISFLGETPDPESGERQVNFDAARYYIDTLAMLQEKTRGNLTPEEDQFLEEMLKGVRLTFVSKMKGT